MAQSEYAARGGHENRRFPWGDDIDHNLANYFADSSVFEYDKGPAGGVYHPATVQSPRTTPVDFFPPNDFGLYDVVGNVSEWLYDWRPFFEDEIRAIRGGDWDHNAGLSRIGRHWGSPPHRIRNFTGFRSVLMNTSTEQEAAVGVDPAQTHAWGENIGWMNAHSTDNDVTVHYSEGIGGWLAGHIWGENVGWIVMGSTEGGPYLDTSPENWGVNVDADGKLSGYAWGENVGWINFEQTHGQPAINLMTGEFSGYAWGENIGWVRLEGTSPDFSVRTLAFDRQPGGTPNWWLARHGVYEGYDSGDGVPAWRKYIMDTDPNLVGDYLKIDSIELVNGNAVAVISPVSPRRFYTLKRREDLTTGEWISVAGQENVPGNDLEQTLTDNEPSTKAYYIIEVKSTP